MRKIGVFSGGLALVLASACTGGGGGATDSTTAAPATTDAGDTTAGTDTGDPGTSDPQTSDPGTSDATGTDTTDTTDPPPDWHPEHCEDRDCYYIMQEAPGADDIECNGRHPEDLGTTDADGKRDCPFAGFSLPVRELLNPPEGETSRRKTFFVGAGSYPVYPFGLNFWGDGGGPDESVILTSYRGAEPVLDGACPEDNVCELGTADGPVVIEPCCSLTCPTCDAHRECVPNAHEPGECLLPWRNTEITLAVWGSFARVEGMTVRGCANDGVRVSWATAGDPPEIVPNDHLYLVNNAIEGCDINENIKGIGSGPGPLDGGPAWGPTEVIGNELWAMASQAVDATGVHAWRVEDSYIHDAKLGERPGVIVYDGGGIGFKNGGSAARVRNNWLERGGSFSGGGTSGSCIDATEPPSPWGCFQVYEMRDILFENNVLIDIPLRGPQAYQCDDCRYLGNFIDGIGQGAALYVTDDCPGPRCPEHNPGLLPSRDLRFERNFVRAGTWTGESPGFLVYFRDVHDQGPALNGMRSRDNTFCGPAGYGEFADPHSQLDLFGHGEPVAQYGLTAFAPQVDDQGSAVFNPPGAAQAACPAGPPACEIGVVPGAALLRWAGPGDCPGCSCALAIDEVEQAVACAGELAITNDLDAAGRHYVSLRVDRSGGGTSCGASYHQGAPFLGAGCRVDVDGEVASWAGDGLRCRLVGDGSTVLDDGPCAGSLTLPDELLTPGRHQVKLQVRDAAFGQTSCSVMFSP